MSGEGMYVGFGCLVTARSRSSTATLVLDARRAARATSGRRSLAARCHWRPLRVIPSAVCGRAAMSAAPVGDFESA